MKKILVLLLTFAFVFINNSCKKGTDDPAFTLQTRKSRLTGRWVMTRGNVSVTSYKPNAAPFVSNFEFSGTSGFLTQSATLVAYSLDYSLSLVYEKDGDFRVIENFNGITLNGSGKWNFTSGVGGVKNKEEVLMKLEGLTSGDVFDHLFNLFSTEFSYKIKRLANKELVINASAKPYMNSSGEKISMSTDYTFRQD